jgi:hypothetical protein
MNLISYLQKIIITELYLIKITDFSLKLAKQEKIYFFFTFTDKNCKNLIHKLIRNGYTGHIPAAIDFIGCVLPHSASGGPYPGPPDKDWQSV